MINKLWRITEKLNKIMWGIWVAVASILLDHLFDKSIKASSINEFLLTYRSTFSGTSLFFVAALVLFMIANMVLNKVTNYLRIRQRPSLQFQKIMNWNTCSELKSVSFSGYSWGYNRTLCIPRDVSGWLPEAFFIRDYDKGKYVFPSEDEGLKGYNSGEYKKFISTDPLVKTITGKDEERIRYAVTHIEQNTNKRSPKVEVDLKETDWLSLQFSWKYLRRLDTDNVPIQGEDQVKSAEVGKAFSDVFQANNKILINSFCLHLILATPNNSVVLAKISKIKSNDYPTTFAATIGEQIEEEDFWGGTGTIENFVVKWVKRALYEEFALDENKMLDGSTELEDYVDMSTLRVLSVDFEGDIYNIALTCSVTLRRSLEDFREQTELRTDQNEIMELTECKLSAIPDILVNYKSEHRQYHPSTYLRLLMFYLSKKGIKATEKDITNALKKQAKKR